MLQLVVETNRNGSPGLVSTPATFAEQSDVIFSPLTFTVSRLSLNYGSLCSAAYFTSEAVFFKCSLASIFFRWVPSVTMLRKSLSAIS